MFTETSKTQTGNDSGVGYVWELWGGGSEIERLCGASVRRRGAARKSVISCPRRSFV